MADGFERPTGLSFSPDGSVLYVADSRANVVRRFTVADDGGLPRLNDDATLITGSAPSLDSMRTDIAGRIWRACSDGVRCYDPSAGTHLGTIRTPEAAASLLFGGQKRNVLYICATNALHSVMLATVGSSARSRLAG